MNINKNAKWCPKLDKNDQTDHKPQTSTNDRAQTSQSKQFVKQA